MDANTTHAALIQEMQEVVAGRERLLAREKDIVTRVFAEKTNAFAELQDNAVALLFQLLTCSDLIGERAVRDGLPVPFMQAMIEKMPAIFMAWSAEQAMIEAAERMRRSNEAAEKVAPLGGNDTKPADDDNWPVLIGGDDEPTIH